MSTSEKYHKHPPLAKPTLGEWGRNEIAIIGAPCDIIRTIAESIASEFNNTLNVCYVDADHADEQKNAENGHQVFHSIFTDRILSRRFETKSSPSLLARRAILADQDVILVNGNHFTAHAQIVLLHSKKTDSLKRKTERLTNVIAVLEIDTTLDDCEFLQEVLNTETRIFKRGEEQNLVQWMKERFNPSAIKGLVLAGGKSIRMGTDKSLIAYYGQPHRDHLLQLLADVKIPAYLSCRQDQMDEIQTEHSIIPDRITGLGPYGALLSAMMADPDSAWLVIAADLPFITTSTLQQLLEKRDPSKIATAFHNPQTGFPEPLITLWEPKAYPVLAGFLTQGISCPRKVLINSDINMIEAEDPRWLMNVNTPDDASAARSMIAHS